MKRAVWNIGVVCVVAVLLGVAHRRGASPEEAQRQERRWTVVAGEGQPVVRERGWLVSGVSAPVTAAISGEIADLLDTGTHVKAGDVVLRVDESGVREALEECEQNVEAIRLEIAQSEAKRELERVEKENEIELVAQRLAFARQEYEVAKAGLRMEDRRLLEIAIEQAELDLEDAQEELDRQQRLLGKGFAAESMVAPYHRRVAAAKTALKESRLQLELEAEGVPEEELEELKRVYERYEARVARGREALESRLAAIDTQLAYQHARFEKQTNLLARVQRELACTETVAPIDGVVRARLYRDWRSAGSIVTYSAGREIDRLSRVADVVDVGKMAVELMVHEADINRLREGMDAEVRLPAYPGKLFRGRVLELGGVGRDRADVAPRGFESLNSGVTVFNARVSLDADGLALRPGMSALVSFGVGTRRAGLLVPREFVQVADGQWSVLRERGRSREWVVVEGRMLDERFYRVDMGVEAGDVLICEEGR
jgi:multidrug resistance efflux pump